MHHYKLVTAAVDGSGGREIDFRSDNAGKAFDLARMQPGASELWVDGRHFCTISQGSEEGFWVLTSARLAEAPTNPAVTNPPAERSRQDDEHQGLPFPPAPCR